MNFDQIWLWTMKPVGPQFLDETILGEGRGAATFVRDFRLATDKIFEKVGSDAEIFDWRISSEQSVC